MTELGQGGGAAGPREPEEVVVVVLGGMDPGGGAGLLRDVATARARGARPWAVGTAWTEQGEGVHRIEARAPAAVAGAIREALRRARPAAVKVGMAVGPATADAILEALLGFEGPVVVDPVLATSRGGLLWAAAPRALLPLLRRATVVTPNAPEAAALAGRSVATVAEAEIAAGALVEQDGLAAVLVKGGHLHLDDGGGVTAAITDVLVTPTERARITHPRFAGTTPRGTGCALATALAVELGRGGSVGEAADRAATWLGEQIALASQVGEERMLP